MTSVDLGWRRFNFFDLAAVSDPTDESRKFNAFKDVNIHCWTPADGFVLLGESKGMIFKVARDLQLQVWQAYGFALNGIALIQRFLFTIGEEEPNAGPVLKLWDLSRWERNEPFCKVISRLSVGKSKQSPPAAVSIAVGATLDLVVVGLEDTSVVFHHGDLLADRTYKWRVLREGINALSDGQMLGVAVAALPTCSVVFSIAENCVQSYQMEGGQVLKKVLHDAKQCEKNCWYFLPSTNTLVLASREVRSFFLRSCNSDRFVCRWSTFYDAHNCIELGNEKGRCLALARGANKLQLIANGPQIALLTQRSAIITTNESSTMCVLNVYDVEFRYIAFQCPMPTMCRMFLLDGEICLIGADGVMHKIVEKSLNDKLDGLIKKSLFDVAIGLAKRHNYTDLQSIFVKYGDYLYSKGDYSNAMQQYVQTIGKVEPSFVIKRVRSRLPIPTSMDFLQFLDGARIKQLCQYLEALHEKKLAHGEHSTLLLGAYIKLNAKDEICALIGKMVDMEHFDLDRAIKASSRLPSARCSFCRSDPPIDRILQNRRPFGLPTSTVRHVPVHPLRGPGGSLECLQIHQSAARRKGSLFPFPSLLIPSFRCAATWRSTGRSSWKTTKAAVVELLKRTLKEKPDCCRLLLPVLVAKPDCLEAIFTDDEGQLTTPNDPRLCITLLEHRLSRWAAEKKKIDTPKLDSAVLAGHERERERGGQVGRQFDVPGLVIFAYQKLKRSEDLMRFLLHEGDVQQIMEMCDERVLKDMWIELVAHVSRKRDLSTGDLMTLLEKAKTSKFLHPLVVLEILARNDALKVADIKDYIVDWLNEQNQIAENEEKIVENEAEIERLEKRNDELENGVQIFQTSKCSACDSSLQVPAIHFLCLHSYHQHCFESFRDGKDSCPACTAARSAKQEALPPSQPQAISHVAFQQEVRLLLRATMQEHSSCSCFQLQNTTSAMNLISEYIRMGVFQADNRE
ncbi:Vacuolar protein sorting-associated protein 11-like protein [Aphelenchoides fujianensis]|nr:Vacuolar protein sorting-associated protein 11-like protein [Aphelenchoides fujianensis]